MSKQVKVPNLFLIVGQPDNGKTTISNWFEKLLGCEVVHTDQLYHSWIKANYPAEFKAAKHNIRGHYGTMKAEWRDEWLEHATNYIIEAAKRAKLDLVVEGWLMLYLTDELRARIEAVATIMHIHMRHYVAHTADAQVKPDGKDYTRSVNELCTLMARSKGISFMRRLVTYQSFEDIRDFQGISDSCGKLLALNLPADLTGKTVLDVGCSTGYFTIRCFQRGAIATGIDKRKKHTTTATRLAAAVYRTTEPKFYHCDFFKWNHKEQYDYVLAINLLSSIGKQKQELFDRAYEYLKPGGTLVVEVAVPHFKSSDLWYSTPFTMTKEYGGRMFQYPNEPAILELAKRYKLAYSGRSVRMYGDRRRRVYHFVKPMEAE